MKRSKRIAMQLVLTTLALIIFGLELALPPLLPGVSGVRIGLYHILILYALLTMGTSSAIWLMVITSIFGPIFAGASVLIFETLAGGILSLATIIVIKKLLYDKIGLIGIGVVGALMHQVGQFLIALKMTSNGAIFAYLPTMSIMAVITGTLTGLLTGAIMRMTKRIWSAPHEEESIEKR